MQGRLRDLALFDLWIENKQRACDLVKLRVRDVCHGNRLAAPAMVLQQETQLPVHFEMAWLVRQLQRGVDDSVSFARFLPERYAHSASDLVLPIGSLAACLCAMRSVQLLPRCADATFEPVAPWLKAATASAPQPGQDEPMTTRSQRPQRM